MSPPNTMVVIKSAKCIPKQFLTYRSSWRPVVEDMNSRNEAVVDDSDVMEVYHGCSVKALLHIAASGFKPTIGTGCDDMEANIGLPIGGVFFTGSWKCASNYPMPSTTGKIPKYSCAVSGGTLLDSVGTYPKRVVIRGLARKSSYL